MPSEEPQTDAITQLHYFLDPDFGTEFQLAQKKMLGCLKRLCEKVVLELQYVQINNPEEKSSIIKEFVNHEVNEQLKKYSKLEQFILLCMLEDFHEFKSYEYPEKYEKIKQEFNWIQDNFEAYVKHCASQEISDPQPQLVLEPYELRNIFNDRQLPGNQNLLPNQNAPQGQENNEEKAVADNIHMLKELYLIDDAIVESMVSVFYIDPNNEFGKSKMLDILSELCHCAEFEIKLVDFCLFFLYCPDHINIQTEKNCSFPYTTIFNSEDQMSSTSIYIQAAYNIMRFLKNYLLLNDYLIYQAKHLLEDHGLTSLRNLKRELRYADKTGECVSVCDMVVGLLEIPEIMSDQKLSNWLTESLEMMFSKENNNFKIIDIKQSEEVVNRTHILTLQSCEKMIKAKKGFLLKKTIQDLLLFNPKIISTDFEEEIEIFNSQFKKVNSVLKRKLQDNPDDIKLDDIQDVLSVYPRMLEFEQMLGKVSLAISEWVIGKIEQGTNVDKEDDCQYSEAMSYLNDKMLNNKMTQDFILNLLELATYLLQQQVKALSKVKDLKTTLVNICTHFYALKCASLIPYNNGDEYNNDPIVFHDVLQGLYDIPELKSTFSEIRNEGIFDFDILYTDLSRKHQETLLDVSYEDNKQIPLKELILICQRLPVAFDFTTKQNIFMRQVELDQKAHNVYVPKKIQIDRNNLILSALFAFQENSLQEVRRPIEIKFKGEQGYDGGGLKREFFSLIGRELFDPKNGLFRTSQNGLSIQPSPNAKLVPNYLNLLKLAGLLLAQALQTNCMFEVTFTKSLLKQLLGKKILFSDFEEVDPDFAKSLKWMLDNPVDEMEQTFVYEDKFLDQRIIKELLPNGSDVLVTDKNKKEYVKKVCEFKLKNEIKEELSAFLEGFHLAIPSDFLKIFSVTDLQILISGVPTLDLEEMKKYATYYGVKQDSDTMEWFWEILEEFTQKELAVFVFFLSGSSRVFPGSFKDIPIQLAKAPTKSSLPMAHTCYRGIDIPEYNSKEEFRQKLVLAMYECSEGFELG